MMECDLIDVFASHAFSGNPLAVVRGGEALDTATMQRLTNWLGFSETSFLLPPTDPAADYRVRIFFPGGELPFAGHPTLGSARAWLAAGGQAARPGRIVQQCGVGLVDVRVEGEHLAFRAPPMRRTEALGAEERAAAARIAGVDEVAILDAVHADNGPAWRLLRLRSAADVLAAVPAPRAPQGTDVGLIGPYPPGGEADWEVRGFFTNTGGVLVEDPVTGSLNAGVAFYLFGTGLAQGDYLAAQGRKTGAAGLVRVSRDADGAIWVGGKAEVVTRGGVLNAIG